MAKVVLAFFLPLMIFVGTLVAAEELFKENFQNAALKAGVSFAAAVVAVFVYLFIIKLWRTKH